MFLRLLFSRRRATDLEPTFTYVIGGAVVLMSTLYKHCIPKVGMEKVTELDILVLEVVRQGCAARVQERLSRRVGWACMVVSGRGTNETCLFESLQGVPDTSSALPHTPDLSPNAQNHDVCKKVVV
jgi:hypothetical protein